MKLLSVLMGVLITFSLSAHAEISPLVIDKSQKKNMVKSKYIKVAHQVIEHNLTQDEVRFTILSAALNSGKIKWLLEEDADNYYILRWDYSGSVIYTKVEFDEQYIQLKYAGAYDKFICKNDIEGICYKSTHKKYYSYMKQLRVSIINALPTKAKEL